MNPRTASIALLCAIFVASTVHGQVTIPLPNRTVNKLLPDYLRPRVYALNQADGTVPGTLLALNSTNGAILGEIPVNLNPTDMAMTPAGDAIYVINTGSRTISKVDLNSFAVVAEKNISTPNTYSLSNPLHLAVGRSNLVYFTDGAWAPSITIFDYANATNVTVYDDGNGAGGINVTRNGNVLYRWRQYGWDTTR
jgi:DNA-binding beta-propeller fold protein YncE